MVDEDRNITRPVPTTSTTSDGQKHPVAVEAGGEPSPTQHQASSLGTGEEGDELSDEVSRDSTMGSDSDTFSSPFCLSPVSEALCESSGSVFLDNECRWVAEK